MNIFKRFMKDDSGTTPIEYGLICLLITMPIVTYAQDIGVKVMDFFNSAAAPL
ncbi:MAG: Flp family type IVb pilin [Rhodospirillales bacterium]|nr:MAG: Flp family type IVb pilin [Rhodospirillales bacterium]